MSHSPLKQFAGQGTSHLCPENPGLHPPLHTPYYVQVPRRQPPEHMTSHLPLWNLVSVQPLTQFPALSHTLSEQLVGHYTRHLLPPQPLTHSHSPFRLHVFATLQCPEQACWH